MQNAAFDSFETNGNSFMISEIETEKSNNIVENLLQYGTDGIILIGKSDRADYRMNYYNADGSRGEMCGNGAMASACYYHDNVENRSSVLIETDKSCYPVSNFILIRR